MACHSPWRGRANSGTAPRHPGSPTRTTWHTRPCGVILLGAVLGVSASFSSAYGQPRIGEPTPAGGAQAQPADNLPPPRKVTDLLLDHPRLEGLGTAQHTGLGRTPIPTKEDLGKINKYVEKL